MKANRKRSGRPANSHYKPRNKTKGISIKGIPTPRIIRDLPGETPTPKQKEGLDALLAVAANENSKIEDRIELIAPKGSILDVIADIFKQTTDIPVELPIFMVISFVSALLVSQSVGIVVAGRLVAPFLWTILLAQSGKGKTYTENFISSCISVPKFPQFNSAAKFVEELSKHNRSLWLQDEFAQLLKRMQGQDFMSDLREYMLRTYDKSEIVRSTKKETISVLDPVLTILGMTVSDTFAANISSEMMLDGFMQRFQIIYADADPARPMRDFPFYRAHEPRWANRFQKAWERISSVKLHGTYRLGSGALDEYEKGFRELVDQLGELPESFGRRIAWNATKLALVYHIILCKSGDIVDRADMKWAMNVTMLHLVDLRRLIDSYGVSDLHRLTKRAEGIRDRFEAEHGQKMTKRDLMQRLKNVNSPGLMSYIMSFIGVGDGNR